ncbi:MAG: 5-bromo-4-chloroindolyl phosphate hydrolysis family protein [bacterium]|nr:5-bromo-4-chloroindolyl phosphate hydrolysis family protein [bacterium]
MAENDFNQNKIEEEFSKNLKEALDTMDFRKLNDTVSESVNLALKEAKDRIAKTAASAKEPRVGSGEIFRQMPQTKQEVSTRTPPQRMTRLERNIPPKLKEVKIRSQGRVVGVICMILGFAGLFCGGIFSLIMLLAFFVSGQDPFALGGFLFFLIMTAGFVGMLGVGCHYNGKNRRLKRYAKAGRGREFITVKELSEVTGKSEDFIRRDLKKMLAAEMLPESRMDEEQTCLAFSQEAYVRYTEAKRDYDKRRLEEKEQERLRQEEERRKAEKAAEEERKLSASSELKAMIAHGNELLRKIQEANDAIEGEEISQKIERLETIVRQIFKAVRENPDEIDEMDKFMDYYLPTTVKLLETYQRFDKVVSPGENILSAKREIEKTLDTIERAFLSLLDDLYQDAAFDAETDAAVLKTMLEQEGLVKNDKGEEPVGFENLHF